ncbi:major capsid protein [Microvirus mar47]|uniref:Major capsid protein n=1 Tax=Microvirus mar47 TaxID=2851182 RepID=A0A8F5MLR6_9VIRU|nr:major capsid protein [Microvirus mar47]
MAGLFSLDDVKNRPHRSSFDLQSKRAFTAKAGELLPVYWTMTLPGDKFKLKNSWFTRTRPVQTSAYTRMREYYDYFFVPLRQLWKQAPSAVMNMTENSTAAQSSTEASNVGSFLPSLSLSELYSALNATSSSPVYAETSNVLGFKRGDLAVKLLRYLGYGNFFASGYSKNYGTSNPVSDYDQTFGTNVSVNILPILAYQKIYNDFFRNTQWENSTPYTYNVDYWTGVGSFATSLRNQLMNHSILGRTMLDMAYCNWNKDLFMGVRPTSQYGDVAIVNIADSGAGSAQNVRLSGGVLNFWGRQTYVKDDSGASRDPVLYTKNAITGDPTDLYVGGRFVDVTTPNMEETYGVSGPDGAVLPTNVPTYARLLGSSGQIQFANTRGQNVSWNDATLQSEASIQSFEFSILALRQAEALQKWKEITLSGDQSYRDQVYKHFGVSLPPEMSDLVRYLGGNSGNLDISEVVNTTLFDPSIVAYVKGKGVGVGDSGTIDFEAKEHGILMCIYHCVPLLDYDLSGQDPQLLVTSVEDLPIPEFDNLGMQELPLVTLYNSPLASSSVSFANSYLGYVPRYAAFKTSYDRVMGAFSTTLRDWVAPVDDSYLYPFITKAGTGVSFPLNYAFFKVNPSILNNIFGLSADSTWDTDQFLVNSQFDVRVVRNLSVSGLPY